MLPDKELQAFNKTFRQDVESKSKLAEDCDGSESGCSCKFVALELGVRPERNDSDQKWRSLYAFLSVTSCTRLSVIKDEY